MHEASSVSIANGVWRVFQAMLTELSTWPVLVFVVLAALVVANLIVKGKRPRRIRY